MSGTSAGTAVNFFVADPAFINPNPPFASYYNQGGIAHLSQKGLSYFVVLDADVDDRDPTTRVVAWAATRAPTVLIDQSFYQQYITDLSQAPDSIREGVFVILDRLLFNANATDDTETYLTTNTLAKAAYIPGTFSTSSSNVTSTVYSTAIPAGVAYSCPAFIRFSISVPTGSSTTRYDITSYADDATWIKDYPNSTIQAVVPPVDYADLLSANLNTSLVNLFASTASAALLNSVTLIPSLDTTTSSGYMVYNATVFDPDGSSTVAPFNILYKGAIPSQLAIRQAVKQAVLASGGTTAQWMARIPSLFVSSRYYLVPFYDLTLSTASSVIFTNILNVATLTSKMEKILTVLDQSTIDADWEILSTTYNRIILGSVPDVSGTNTTVSLHSLYPDYQDYAATESNFSYQSAATQLFSTTLSAVLAVATGNVTSTVYVPTLDRTLEYISFTEGEVEFCVITKNGYYVQLSEAS